MMNMVMMAGSSRGSEGGQNNVRKWGVILTAALVAFVLFELAIEFVQNEDMVLSIERTPGYANLAAQRENVAKERQRLKIANEWIAKKEELLRKEFETLGQLELFGRETEQCNENCNRNQAYYYEYLRDHVEQHKLSEEERADKMLANAKFKGEFKLKTRVVLAIFSPADNAERRRTIRNTMLRIPQSAEIITTKFIIGGNFEDETLHKTLSAEINFYKDIVLFDKANIDKEVMYDSNIANGGEKSKLFYQYVYAHYIPEYVMKIDDETYIRLDNLMSLIETLPKRWVYWGHFNTGQKVSGDLWGDPTYFEINDRYATYATPFSIISRDVLHFIVLSPIDLNRWAMSDASVGTWLSPLNLLFLEAASTASWRLMPPCIKCSCEEVTLLCEGIHRSHPNRDQSC
jgi:hypothetical protein